jgi:glutathione S-transferase
MKIYDFAASPNARKVRSVAYELGLTPEWVVVNIFKGENRSPEFLAKNPNGLIPVLEDGDLFLWESNAIINYLAAQRPEAGLLPADARARADVDRWMFWQSSHIGPAVVDVAYERVVRAMMGHTPDEARIARGLTALESSCQLLDKHLAGKEFVAGKLSVADFAIASLLSLREMAGLPIGSFSNLMAWQSRIEGRPSFQKALGDAAAIMGAGR